MSKDSCMPSGYVFYMVYFMLLQQQEHLVANINPVGSEFAVAQFSMLRPNVRLKLNRQKYAPLYENEQKMREKHCNGDYYFTTKNFFFFFGQK